MITHQPRPPIPATLRQQWFGFVLLLASALTGGCFVLFPWWPLDTLACWVIVVTLVFGYEATLLWRGLALNYHKQNLTLLPRLETSSILTLLRGVPLGLLAGFAVLGRPIIWHDFPSALITWAPAILYTLVVTGDLLAKFLLCKTHTNTFLSKRLDSDFEALAILIASVVGMAQEQLPYLYLLVPLAHYALAAGVELRKRLRHPVSELPFNVPRRMVMVAQTFFLYLVLSPFYAIWDRPLAGFLFMLPFVASKLYDWLLISGRHDPALPAYNQIKRLVSHVIEWVTPAIRFTVVLTLALMMINSIFSRVISVTRDHPILASLLLVVTLLEIIILAMLALGYAGRIAAAAWLLLVSIGMIANTPFLVACNIALLYLGTGRLSLWTEDYLLAYISAKLEQHSLDPISQEQLTQGLRGERLSWLGEKWRSPMKLSNFVKILIGLGTAWVTLYHLASLVFSAAMLLNFQSLAQGSQESSLSTLFFSNMTYFQLLQIFTSLIQFVLTTFYLIHVVKNTTATEIIRVILGVGVFYMPYVTMPIYYYVYIWLKQPPAWALDRSATQNAQASNRPSNDITNTTLQTEHKNVI